ncbi:AAA family ATPase [Thermincola potens]|uniref:ATPase associated with various cellular activities AAA_3 n=1 Tax=Thermincola potens (strain JR) TaxID=635013 RepID=D5XEW0_THEPJ|nr:MoxR family ATPase [Thermincola potens]ADG82181.1 ATPase associated with various cellular activities AAA_3 [Thermincola potens JR]
MFKTVNDVMERLSEVNYLVDEKLATSVFLAVQLNKPLLVEGPAGVGKTELAKAVASALQTDLIRLQCYEGLDESKALFEWNYQKQLLRIQANHLTDRSWEDTKKSIFSEEFCLPRPLLKAIQAPKTVVLLIDELDKSDEEFESFLLEVLSDYQVSIPEMGTIKARSIPIVVLTSNNYRDFSDALKRRCIHVYIDYPSFERELAIVRLKVPGISQDLAKEIVHFVQALRKIPLKKAPSISETLDWARTMILMGVKNLDARTVENTINLLIKYQQDVEKIQDRISGLLG